MKIYFVSDKIENIGKFNVLGIGMSSNLKIEITNHDYVYCICQIIPYDKALSIVFDYL